MAESVDINDSMTLPALRMHVEVAPDATHEQAMEAVNRVCGALSRQEASVQHLRILLGRMMIEVKDRRLYRPAHKTFESFSQEVAARHHLARTTVRDSMMIARTLPMLEPEAAEGIPITNITLAARAAKNMEAPAIRSLLKSAARMNVVKFTAKVRDEKLVPQVGRPAGAASGMVTLRIRVTRSVASKWAEMVGTKDPGRLLGKLLTADQALAA